MLLVRRCPRVCWRQASNGVASSLRGRAVRRGRAASSLPPSLPRACRRRCGGGRPARPAREAVLRPSCRPRGRREVNAPRVALPCEPPLPVGGVPAAPWGLNPAGGAGVCVVSLPLPLLSSQPARGFAGTGLLGWGAGARPLRPLGPTG